MCCTGGSTTENPPHTARWLHYNCECPRCGGTTCRERDLATPAPMSLTVPTFSNASVTPVEETTGTLPVLTDTDDDTWGTWKKPPGQELTQQMIPLQDAPRAHPAPVQCDGNAESQRTDGKGNQCSRCGNETSGTHPARECPWCKKPVCPACRVGDQCKACLKVVPKTVIKASVLNARDKADPIPRTLHDTSIINVGGPDRCSKSDATRPGTPPNELPVIAIAIPHPYQLSRRQYNKLKTARMPLDMPNRLDKSSLSK